MIETLQFTDNSSVSVGGTTVTLATGSVPVETDGAYYCERMIFAIEATTNSTNSNHGYEATATLEATHPETGIVMDSWTFSISGSGLGSWTELTSEATVGKYLRGDFEYSISVTVSGDQYQDAEFRNVRLIAPTRRVV